MPAPTGYSRLQIRLHWIIAALIVLQYLFKNAIAAAWDAAQKGIVTEFDPLVMAHVVGGGLVAVLTLWRISVRRSRGAPLPPQEEHPALKLAAKATHLGLYALMLLMPLSGAMAWFGGVQTAAFGHNVMKVVLLALVALHVLGALYHQFVLRNNLLLRMKTPQA